MTGGTGQSWWHGGANGFGVGAEIVPAPECGRSWVPVSTDRELARADASVNTRPRGGTLYRVQPGTEPVAEPRDGSAAGWSTTDRVRVLAVEEVNPVLDCREHTRLCAPAMFWVDDSPVYDPEGHLLPSPAQRRRGVDPVRLRELGPWLPLVVLQGWLGQHEGELPGPEGAAWLVEQENRRLQALKENADRAAESVRNGRAAPGSPAGTPPEAAPRRRAHPR
ncbi:hypothetical protein [Cellulomonas denverensis]|uniref:Uncharacterized protein n=1 Tax=Cellulomonas denverensis TaxID=264297 RepID=A0A7X6KYB3_9CELL|nr:hypothetical protein [Cellulomonas denverensis]NKY24435.1 hypothetical protein [Cellulomonas denverensis]GIG26587.1 hypothetical protein Cde04nite_28310 [Cellulomonas denverensis]